MVEGAAGGGGGVTTLPVVPGETRRQRKYRELKWETLMAYSSEGSERPACWCCGEDDFTFLSLDHLDNDGAEHRAEMFGRKYARRGSTRLSSPSGTFFYEWLQKQGYPKDRRMAPSCANCQQAHRNGRKCPHEVARENAATMFAVAAGAKGSMLEGLS